jgi:hypothetical protein
MTAGGTVFVSATLPERTKTVMMLNGIPSARNQASERTKKLTVSIRVTES